jgi:YidC/Oxa1 family membrane protein insertase
LWAAVTNKYFAAIVVPAADPNADFCNWLADRSGWFNSIEGGEGDIGIDLKTTAFTLAPAGQPQSSKIFGFKLFIGPKDKGLFDKNPMYKDLGFINTIDFMACCCPAAIIYPLGFGILAIMKGLYGFIPNYGVVIIILVLLVRLLLHPLTRKSQVSMSEYSKFNSLPEVQEIRKQYGKNMMEMNRRIAEVQKKHGVSHSAAIMGMLPTLVQMPIWIALYGAIYASIDLRGAKFLPFWITDLSAPDALFKFPGGFTIPYFGDSFNLLPILMGIAFYLQQKLMPSQATAPTPEAAQQQKMMMFMMPLMFPLMLYTSPSGLNLYIMASVFGGVIEQYVIKKHIQKKEQKKAQGLVAVTSKTGGKVKKPKPKPFFKM